MAKDPTKVVVRLLPPLITEDELLSTINEEHVKNARMRFFIPGRRIKGDTKPSRNALCYFYFSSSEHAEPFIRDYHGHKFVDDQGEQFRAVACYAPYQKAPKSTVEKDNREGTIEDDPAYKEFIEGLNKPKEAFVAPENPFLSLKPADPASTPLLLHLKNRAKERRERLEKRAAKKWKPSGEAIDEEWDWDSSSKRSKWYCSGCGTKKHLEEDPNDRGSFYCTYCWESWEQDWESWEQADGSKPKKKKKKKKAYEEEEEYYEEPSSRRSRKKKEKEDAEAEDWYGTNAEEEEEGERKKSRRKKKEKKETAWDGWGEESWNGDSWYEESSGRKWRPKGSDEAEGKQWKPKSKKDKEEQWVEKSETASEKPRRSRKSRRDEWW